MPVSPLNRSVDSLLEISERQAKRIRELESTLRLRDGLIDSLDAKATALANDLTALQLASTEAEDRAFDAETITGLNDRILELEAKLAEYDHTELARIMHDWARDTLPVPHELDVPLGATPEAYRKGLACHIMAIVQRDY